MMSNKKRVRKDSKILKYMKSPIKILARARDFYISGLSGCGENVSFGNTMGCPTPQIHTLPKSYSTNSGYRTNEEKLEALIRFASTRKLNEPELLRSRTAPVNRSNTPVFTRIDEEVSHEFGVGDDAALLRGGQVVVSRSRSCCYGGIAKKKKIA